MPDDQPTRRFRFNLRQLFLAVAMVAVGLGIWTWLFHKEVVVRVATPEDDQEVFNHVKLNPLRSAAVVTGSFTNRTSLLISMHVVRAGVVEHLPGGVFARDEISGGRFWEDVKLWLYFMDGASLRVLWTENGDIKPFLEQWYIPVKRTISVVATETLPATITPGRPHIVYVEGDRQIVVDGKMTVEDFAKANPGNYLVVTVEVR